MNIFSCFKISLISLDNAVGFMKPAEVAPSLVLLAWQGFINHSSLYFQYKLYLVTADAEDRFQNDDAGRRGGSKKRKHESPSKSHKSKKSKRR